MRLKLLLISLLIVFTSFFSLPIKVKAISQSSILVDVVPENPAPYENTSITLSSYAVNLDSVSITWSVNGKSSLSGIGRKSFLVNAPAAGGETTVTATIALPEGVIEKIILIRPAVMALLWQANDSYVPPFYKGKALPMPDSEIKVVAMPEIKNNGNMVSPQNMTYTWKLDYTNNPEGSGYGKNYFIYSNDYLEDINNINVVVNTIDQKYSAEGNINIGTNNPKILFYKNDANLGTVWEQALKDGHKIQGDEVIEAAPYFISPKDIRIPTLTWDWSINDSLISVLSFRPNLIPLKVQEGTSGTSKIRLEINNKYKIFATTSQEINVEF